MTIKRAYTTLLYQLFDLYGDRESANISDWILEHITGLKKIDRIVNKHFELNDLQQAQLQQITNQLLNHKPVQYVLKEAWFAGIKLYVDENVLIPRPETEELVEWIIDEAKNSKAEIINLLDIGTGSGCIPIAIKNRLPFLKTDAIDISEKALHVAKKNATDGSLEINFTQLNILDKNEWKQLNKYDIIVSNPPYIKQSEAKDMNKNVLLFEPAIALFVPDNNALLFYETIATFGLQHLSKKGILFFEINELLGENVLAVLKKFGYINTELKKDMQGKNRMIKARLP